MHGRSFSYADTHANNRILTYQTCPEVDQGLASICKVINMRETPKSKSFLQTLYSIRIIPGVDLVKVCNDSLNVRGTVLRHVFTDRREVAVIVAAQIGGGSDMEQGSTGSEHARYRFHDTR